MPRIIRLEWKIVLKNICALSARSNGSNRSSGLPGRRAGGAKARPNTRGGETYDGDIPAVAQGDPAAKERVERAAVERLAGCLPEGAGRELRGVWEEYEACRTPEAKLVKALDKAETILQHNQGQNPSGFDYEFNLGYGAEWFRADEMLQRLRGLLDADTLRHLEK